MELRKYKAQSLYAWIDECIDEKINNWIESNPKNDIINIQYQAFFNHIEQGTCECVLITYFDLTEEQ